MDKSPPDKNKNKGGRPPVIVTDEMIATTRDLAKNGIKVEFIAERLKISVPTFYSKPELADAYHDEITTASQEIASALQDKAKNGDTTSQIFWLKTRARWGTQDYIKIKNFEGDYRQKMAAISDIFKEGVMSVENYVSLSKTLTDQFKVSDHDDRIKALEEKMNS